MLLKRFYINLIVCLVLTLFLILRLHDASIRVQSTVNKGSIFSISFNETAGPLTGSESTRDTIYP